MKKIRVKAILSALMIMLTVTLLPVSTFAAADNAFVLVAEADGKLIIAPEYVNYTEEDTIASALEKSGHSFAGLIEGWIYEIDGVSGEFKRSDETGNYDLSKPASEIKYFRFSEEPDSMPSEGLQKLMTAMADYLQEAADVQNAAKTEYDTAYSQFAGISSASATALAEELNNAVNQYKAVLSGTKHTVTFENSAGIYSDVLITATNEYGKVWQDEDGNGKLELPAGKYTFCISDDGLSVKGTANVSASITVTADLPQTNWINTDTFRLSGSFDAVNKEDGLFTDDEFTIEQWNGRKATVPVTDTFTGTVYSYVEYTTETRPKLTASYMSYGEQTTCAITFGSFTSGAPSALRRGSVGNTIVYTASITGEDGYTYSQEYTVDFARVPTLRAITVSDQEGTDQAATEPFDAEKKEYTYKVLDEVTAVTIKAVPYSSEYSVKVNGKDASNGVEIALNGDKTAQIKVAYGEYESVYTLDFLKGAGQKVTFKTAASDVQLVVANKNNMVMPCKKYKGTDNGNYYQYTLVTEDEYFYVATRDTYYHVKDSFSLQDLASSTITVDVDVDNWLEDMAFSNKKGYSSKGSLPMNESFSAGKHNYTLASKDTEHNIYIWCTASDTENIKIEAIYDQIFSADLYHGKERTIEIKSTYGSAAGTQVNRFLADEHPQGNKLTIRLTKEDDGITYYQDYIVDVIRKLSLNNITARCDGSTATLVKEDGSTGFVADVTEYNITVPMAAQKLSLSITKNSGTVYGEEENSYRILADGKNVTTAGSADIELDGTINTQTVIIKVESDQAQEGTTEYVINVLKSPPVETTFNLNPSQAVVTLYETLSEERLWPNDNGSYQLCEGFSYNYTMTMYGYIGKTGTLNVTRDSENALVVTDGDIVYKVAENTSGGAAEISWSLEKAPVNENIDTTITSEWPDFRGDPTNNGITEAKIPYKAEKGTLYWANKLGDGIDSGAVGSPIIVNGDIITYAGNKLYRVDTITGEILAIGTMDHTSSFSITPPVYAEGMIFVALANGTVQAFNAKTLESLWIYKDALEGQPNCPITVKNGYLYTGFWIGEKNNANFVCLSITDENPAQTDEKKAATWFYTNKGGYYWAGAYVNDDFVVVGTDDGESGYTSQTSRLLLLDSKTGELYDSWDNLNGDIRSTVVFDKTASSYHFTSKGGSFYGVKVAKDGDGYKFTDGWYENLANGTDGIPMSTSSPVVYNGRAYVGVSGSSQFGNYSGHNITVIDLTTKTTAYRVETQGYPQTSGLLTTAYEKISGNVYVYFFDNSTPGKLRVISDKPGQTVANYITTENGRSTAYALFTPVGDQAQYAICSPVTDEYGTIYFKNDSAHLMAYGSMIESIEITQMPDKTKYAAGEYFDPTGMQITARYSNGNTRDITKYVSYRKDALTAEDELFTISFEHVMYHNQENGTVMQEGVITTTPTAVLDIDIISTTLGDIDSDGDSDADDAQIILDYETGIYIQEISLDIADVSGDGVIDSNDAVLILQYAAGKIEVFPAEQ